MSSPARRLNHEGIAAPSPHHGVITLAGYGTGVRVDRGHLILEDGIGADRQKYRLPRVGHGLKRLVVIGSDGQVSLSALRWLADQDASFVMLDRDGSVLMTTGPVRSSEAKVRRAQALAMQNGKAMRISCELVDRKLAGQQRVVAECLGDESAALMIRQFRSELAEAETIDAVRLIEAQAAKIYWAAWRMLKVAFPRQDLPRVPEHWRGFGSRMSLLTGVPHRATNPVNAILNYLYAVLEAESRLAAAALGLDPGIGVLHTDKPYRDSLACDLMEPIRPEVDAFVLEWLMREPLPRNWFFEQRDGNCRLMAPFASELSQTASTWAHLVRPVAEWFAGEICKPNSATHDIPALRGQRNERMAKARSLHRKYGVKFKVKRVCRDCGKELENQHTYCYQCSMKYRTERMKEAASLGRAVAHEPTAKAKRVATQRVNMQARWDWKPSDLPPWLTGQFYSEKIQPILETTSGTAIAQHLKVSRAYALHIRQGRVPHPRHWKALADLIGLSEIN